MTAWVLDPCHSSTAATNYSWWGPQL
uniref:Uncharacterized protein n=1 Tax=Anguilla anguilla TaxID=7936 RepID=A0A0E9TXT1_ANGAN